MRRVLVLLTILILASVIFLAVRAPEQSSRTPNESSSEPEKTLPGQREQGRAASTAETTNNGTTLARSPEKQRCPNEKSAQGESTGEKSRIGNFDRPKNVPEYEILEDEKKIRDCARAAQLLVDTTSRSQEDYVLIARDIKARYKEYDAVSAEFIDTNGLLDYHGSALIFNTQAGSTYLGYVYGPLNTRGYYVVAAD